MFIFIYYFISTLLLIFSCPFWNAIVRPKPASFQPLNALKSRYYFTTKYRSFSHNCCIYPRIILASSKLISSPILSPSSCLKSTKKNCHLFHSSRLFRNTFVFELGSHNPTSTLLFRNHPHLIIVSNAFTLLLILNVVYLSK